MGIAKNIIGAVITVAIGGTVYTVSQTDVINNFAKDTGMSQQEAKDYVENAKDNLASWDKVGDTYIDNGNAIIDTIAEIDCVNYSYEWETSYLTCNEAKSQLRDIGNNEVSLGNAFKKLSQESSTKADIPIVIDLIDKANEYYDSYIFSSLFDAKTIEEAKKTNSYNKALLQAALDAE